MNRKIIIAIFLCQAITQSLLAQDTSVIFSQVKSNDGKPLGKINGIAQDKNGYMWFGGQTEKCLYQYDGNRITSFKHDDSNSNSLGVGAIETIAVDKSGTVWVGFVGSGLDRYDPSTNKFTHYNHLPDDPGSLIISSVLSILGDSKDRLWVGTPEGLDLLDKKTGKFTHYKHEPGDPKSISNDHINVIYEDRTGTIWIGTGSLFGNSAPGKGGLNRLEPDGTFTRFMHDPKNPNSLINNKVRSIFEDSRGVFWIGTLHDGLHTMERKTGRVDRHLYDPLRPDKLSRPVIKAGEFTQTNDLVTFINEDGAGNIWIGTIGSGISKYDPISKKINHYEANNGYSDASAWCSFTSRDGVIWFGTLENNLIKAEPILPKIKHNPTPNFQTNKFSEDDNGDIWITSQGGVLLKFDKNKKFIRQFRIDSLSKSFMTNNGFFSIFQNAKDTLMIGSSKGILLFDKIRHTFSKWMPEFDSVMTLDIKQDREGLLWLTTLWSAKGLIQYNPTTNKIKWYRHNASDSTSIGSDRTIDVLEDQRGIIWVSTMGGGLNVLDKQTNTFKHYLKSSSVVTQLYEDSQGLLWAGTQNGLFKYNRKEDKFSLAFDSQTNIINESIYGIEEDHEKNLWIITHSLVARYNPLQNEILIFGNNDGIYPNSIIPGSFKKTSKGEMFIGSERGFYSFFPEELAGKKPALKILITDLSINNLPVRVEKGSPLISPIEETDEINLSYDKNNFSFNFATIDYRTPEAIRYFTMLENYDNVWRPVIGEKSGRYFFITPGHYTFRVRAISQDGTKAEKTISIHIQPPLWKTWWAYGGYGLLFIGMLRFTYRYQRQQLIRSERERTQQKEVAQAREIAKAYAELKSTQSQLIHAEKMASLGELTAGIAHEIQNPLNFVNNFSELNKELINEIQDERLKTQDKRDEALEEEILRDIRDNSEKINHHGKRAADIVKGMLQHSRSSSGIKEQTDINVLADEYLRLAYHGLRAKDKSFNAIMKTDFDEGIGKINAVPQDLGRVILNLITNAFYAVAEKKKQIGDEFEPTVTVSTKRIENKVEIRVSDNGNGIPQSIIDKIFQPFFTTKPSGKGTGLGLSMSYEIVTKGHGGELKVETKENEGTSFIIILPN